MNPILLVLAAAVLIIAAALTAGWLRTTRSNRP